MQSFPKLRSVCHRSQAIQDAKPKARTVLERALPNALLGRFRVKDLCQRLKLSARMGLLACQRAGVTPQRVRLLGGRWEYRLSRAQVRAVLASHYAGAGEKWLRRDESALELLARGTRTSSLVRESPRAPIPGR